MTSPTADVSVRVGWADDAPALAALQVRAWRTAYADLLPADVLDSLTADALEEQWRLALTRPSDARQRVLIALERATVTGFALTAPASDPDADTVADGEMLDLTVDPERLGEGHGSRLMQAAVDTLRADHFTRATTWLASDHDALRGFLTSAGWSADGAHRTLDLTGDGTTLVKQVRLHTRIAG